MADTGKHYLARGDGTSETRCILAKPLSCPEKRDHSSFNSRYRTDAIYR